MLGWGERAALGECLQCVRVQANEERVGGPQEKGQQWAPCGWGGCRLLEVQGGAGRSLKGG